MDPDKNVNDLNKSLSSFEEIATACMGNYKFRYLNIPALFTKMELVRASERAKRTSEMSICTREEIFQKKSFRYTAKIGLWQIFHFLIFVLIQEKCHYQSH